MEMIPLTEMKKNASGTITGIHGGRRMMNRLDTLGIRPGKRIRKISQQALRGPVVVEIDRVQVAVGYGMASHIMVQADGG